MRNRRQLTEDEDVELCGQIGDALREGLTNKEIAAKLDCSPHTVAYLRGMLIIPGATTLRRTKFTTNTELCPPERRREIVSYYKTHSIRDTSNKYRIRPECISRLARMEGYYKPPGRPSASNRLLGDLGLRLTTQRVPGSTHMHTYHLEHIISSRRLRISKTDYRNIRKGAASWLKEHADKVSAALRA